MSNDGGTTLPEMATLHESTVQRAEEATREMAKIGRSRRATTYTAAKTTKHIKVHPLVWEKALELAQGEPSRIKIISRTEVVVMNASHSR